MDSIDFFPAAAAIGLNDESQSVEVRKLERFEEIARRVGTDGLIGGHRAHTHEQIAFHRFIE